MNAGEAYHDPSGWSNRERRAEQVYREEVKKPKDTPVDKVVDGAVRFLSHWNAVRFPGGSERLRAVLPEWLAGNAELLSASRGKELQSLVGSDFRTIIYLAGSLWELGFPPTTFGKLLHILLPETVLLWDADNVRNGYRLGEDPYSFTGYQAFGWRLLHGLQEAEGQDILASVKSKHARTARFDEPLTKLIDELTYSHRLRRSAEEWIGEDGFSASVFLK